MPLEAKPNSMTVTGRTRVKSPLIEAPPAPPPPLFGAPAIYTKRSSNSAGFSIALGVPATDLAYVATGASSRPGTWWVCCSIPPTTPSTSSCKVQDVYEQTLAGVEPVCWKTCFWWFERAFLYYPQRCIFRITVVHARCSTSYDLVCQVLRCSMVCHIVLYCSVVRELSNTGDCWM